MYVLYNLLVNNTNISLMDYISDVHTNGIVIVTSYVNR